MKEVGTFIGKGNTKLKIYQNVFGVYYLDQNPKASSIYARAVRVEGADIKWELGAYPDDYRHLAYTGNVMYDNRVMSRNEARKILINHQLEEIKRRNKWRAEKA